MTVTNEQIQALKAKAVDRIIAEIKAKHSHYDAYAPVMTWGEFCTIVTERAADKALIAELKNDVDAANARVDAGCAQLCKQDDLIATLHDACSQWERKDISNFEECAEMSARIEELEARTVSVKLPPAWLDGEGPVMNADEVRAILIEAGINLEIK